MFDPTALNGVATNPSFPSGHTTYAFTDGVLLAMTAPQAYQSMMLRASEYGESRIVLGVHYPLGIVGGRALSYYDLAQAFTNPLYIDDAATTGTAIDLPSLYTPATAQMQSYLAVQRGASVGSCATSAANGANNPSHPSAANPALFQQRQASGLPTLTAAQGPREAAPTGGPDASILLAPLYGSSSIVAQRIAPGGGLYGTLATDTINQIVVNTESNAITALYGTPLSDWSRVDLHSAAGSRSAPAACSAAPARSAGSWRKPAAPSPRATPSAPSPSPAAPPSPRAPPSRSRPMRTARPTASP